ncbi:hypothetical protein TPHA_0B04740 [Tetrapisispora phaffii CBS 4417]|uniref:NADH:flavin oxidoreductase/NADH oxidase N-terminal domain-containing protein n=1 Tax=Tetrapisispora phaffii (strain ATCC 24235 / CBS 4417 / NBRC 1672 / NRRL Y-8282 / UCD 70-5) TaxID=1071381 RepID=G8BQ62_TETPH|nr:hypothetical protein TPHA_0B04740 [Tetrapisispora phaffii CBS 4417]CCE62143.1 hypothetical protein TPHA_0B04740 [Tetrapisispora phaffii CBS 4417]
MSTLTVKPAPNCHFFTPEQPVLGQFVTYNDSLKGENLAPPKLFHPLAIRDTVFPNRIGVSPMCTYSSNNHEPTEFHQVHYGAWASRGCGMIIVECTGVDEAGMISSNDLGIWNKYLADKHYEKIVEFAHSQNCKIGVQLGHCGCKKEMTATGNEIDSLYKPAELDKKSIKEIVRRWGHAANLAVNVAHYDFIEIQGGHGNLISEFLNKNTNHRTDEYGGSSFANRCRLLNEVVTEVRKEIGNGVPLFLRLSGTMSSLENEKSEEWTIEDTINLSHHLYKCGVDVVDVTGGGHHVNEMTAPMESLSNKIKLIKQKTSKLKVASPGGVHSAKEAEKLINDEDLDILLVGRPFLENPGLVNQWSEEMGIKVSEAVQYTWGFYPANEHLTRDPGMQK